MIYYKTVSAGNDFLHVTMEAFNAFAEAGRVSHGDLARALCRRHSGAGADGVVIYSINDDTVDFQIRNRDGSRAELSGNGMAGLSALMFYLDEFKDRVCLRTDAGTRTHRLLDRQDNQFSLKVQLGPPDFNNTRFFPFLEKNRLCYTFENITFYPVSTGNPHVVVLPGSHCDPEELEKSGRRMENHELFPCKTNVEFILEHQQDWCRVFYYERGVGRTTSSSTGSAGVFAVLQKLRLIKDRLTVRTPGGEIKITGDRDIYIENSTKIVYKGIYLG